MDKIVGIAVAVSTLLLAIALVVGSLLVQSALDRQTAAIDRGASALASVQDVLKTLNQSIHQVNAASRPSADTPTAANGPDSTRVYSIATAGAPFVGKPDAKVTIVEFADFQCPYCASVRPILETIRQTYGDQVQLVFKHLPLSFHALAPGAAAASEAAHRQGKFWEFANLIFNNQNTLDDEHYRSWAKELGLNLEKWEKDRQSPEVKAHVEADRSEAEKLGINGTPAFFVNGRLLLGAQPFTSFKTIIDQEIANPSTVKQ